jgi:hypothetical protein
MSSRDSCTRDPKTKADIDDAFLQLLEREPTVPERDDWQSSTGNGG